STEVAEVFNEFYANVAKDIGKDVVFNEANHTSINSTEVAEIFNESFPNVAKDIENTGSVIYVVRGYILGTLAVIKMKHLQIAPPPSDACWVQSLWLIIHAQGTKSQTRWLQRHEAFLRCRNMPYSRYYGANVFSCDAQIILRRNLDRIFLKKKLAECYVSKVLQKEAMIAILHMHSAVGN
ncbi:hypothetical protein MAR_016376, partial [Mya arenaria]